jgi:integrase/recombinase XerD
MGRRVATLKKGPRRFGKPVGNPADPDGLVAFLARYLDALRVKGQTDATLWNVERYVRDFIEWCDARGLERPTDITKPILESYQRFLHYYRKRDGHPLSHYSQRAKLIPLKGFFKWLTRHNHLLYNPASELEMARLPRRLPRHVLSVEDVEAVMRQVDTSDPLGIRDRAVMETLYSTGIRRMELVNLHVPDVDVERGTVLIRQGKGRKDRLIPIGERALDWIGRYLARVRLHLVVGRDEGTLFLTRTGEAFNMNWLSRTVGRYIDAACIGKRGGCHLFRHTMATLMLEGGADIRYVQAMLGHAELSTTEIYTQVAIRALKAVHAATHPADAKHRSRVQQAHDSAVRHEARDVAALLAALDEEADDEAADVVRH